MKTAFIIHGFNGDTVYTFGPSLKSFLEAKGYYVIMPSFPIRSDASYIKWSKILDEDKEYLSSDSIVIAHSIGNPFFIKYISQNNLKVGTYISVAGFCDLFTVPEREDLNRAFIDFAVNDSQIDYTKKTIPNKFSLYSDNDHVIPLNILKNFISKMGSSPIFIKGVGHMGNRDNISSLPQIESIINKLGL